MRSLIIDLSILVGLFIPGLVTAQTQTLPAGWSMVGINSGSSVDPIVVFGNATTSTPISPSVTTVWTWNNALNRWNFFAPSMTAQELSTYAGAKGYSVLSNIGDGEGFWVNAKNQFLYDPTSTTSTINPRLSTKQQLFESYALAVNGGSFNLNANLPSTGMPSSASGNYFFAGVYKLASSPGPSETQPSVLTALNMSSSLALPSWASTPSRLLKNGVIFVSPSYPGFARISYPDSGIQEDWFSADPMTVVFSSYFFYYDSQPLTGTIANSPPELISYLGNLLSNAALLKPDASWQPGASFSKVSNRSLSGEIYVDDCFGAPTVNANVTPCASNTTLTAYLQTISSASAGSTSTIQNLPFWVAAGYSAGTPFYQVYFQLNNNVYRGSLKKAGTQSVNMASLNPTYSPTYVDWRWRFNSAAVSSLKAALTF